MVFKLTLLICILSLSMNVYGQTLGNYPATSTGSGRSINVTPVVAPTNTVGMLVTSSAEFLGVLTGNPVSGKVRIVNPRPAGTYTIKVKAFSSTGTSTSKTFILTVGEPDCSVGDLSSGTVVTTGLNQVMSVIGDFNQDGIQDVAAAHEGGNNTLSIRIGNGSGGFSGTMELPVGSHPYSVAIGDVDKDGIQDLVTANAGDNAITPILGVGNGTFIVKPVCDVGTSPISIVIADFNSDGNPDVATANLNANTISIRQGNGGGFFYGTTDIPVGSNPYNIAIGDFNNDGKTDLVTANSADNSVSVRLGNGSGGFTNSPDVPVGINPLCVVVSDFNEDGFQDIATANYVVNTISIRLGNGTGNFSGNVEIPTGIGPYNLAIGNFNGDSHKDIVITNYFDNTVSMRFGDGTGGFVNGNDVAVGSYPTCVTVGEFNQDHFMDIIVSNFNDGAVSVHLGLLGFPPVDSVRTNSPVCEGMDLELHAYGGVDYLWTGPTGYSSTMGYSGRLNMTMADSGLYQVVIEDSGHCVATETIHVIVWPKPSMSFFLVNDTICSGSGPISLIGGFPPGGLYIGDGMFGNLFDPGFTGPGEFEITYVFFDEHDCSQSDSEKIFVVVCTEAQEISENNVIGVYPNPARDELFVQLSNQDATALLYTTEGVLVKKWILRTGRQSRISIGDLPAGVYMLKLSDHEHFSVTKVVKQ